MYKCEICGMIFDEPHIREYSEPRPDGFREKFRQVLCPACLEPYFEEMTKEEEEDDNTENLRTLRGGAGRGGIPLSGNAGGERPV